MKKTISLFILLFLTVLLHAAIDKKLLSSVVSVSTTDSTGQSIGKAWGVVIPSDSTASSNTVTVITPYSLLKHATRAVITDEIGRAHV